MEPDTGQAESTAEARAVGDEVGRGLAAGAADGSTLTSSAEPDARTIDPASAGVRSNPADATGSPSLDAEEEGDIARGLDDEGADDATTPDVEKAHGGVLAEARARRTLAAGVLVVAAGFVLTAAVVATGLGRGSPASPPVASPTPTAGLSFEGRTIGRPDAPVRIEVWADFQCPFCGLFTHGVEPSLVREYALTGKADVTFRDYAFLGQESVDAAVAARCAGAQGHFWLYHDLLFASQRGENSGAFSTDVLLGLGRFAQLDVAQFSSCLADPAVAEAVAAETAQGRTAGIESTPTVRIVGPVATVVLKGVVDPGKIAAAIERSTSPAASMPGGSGLPGANGAGTPAVGATPDPNQPSASGD